jgi:hypothetical protein
MKRTPAQQKADKKYELKRQSLVNIHCRFNEDENRLIQDLIKHFKTTKKDVIIKGLKSLKDNI